MHEMNFHTVSPDQEIVEILGALPSCLEERFLLKHRCPWGPSG